MAQLQLIKQSPGNTDPATPRPANSCNRNASSVPCWWPISNRCATRRFTVVFRASQSGLRILGAYRRRHIDERAQTGYRLCKILGTFGGNEPALLNAAEQYLERIADRRAGSISACKSFDAYRAWVTVEAGHYDAINSPTALSANTPVASRSPTWTKQSSISCIRPHSMFYGAGFCTSRFAPMREAENAAAQLMNFAG